MAALQGRTLIYAYKWTKNKKFEYDCCINADHIIAAEYLPEFKYYKVFLSCPPLDLDTAGGDARLDCPEGSLLRNLYVKEESMLKVFNII